MQLFVSAAWNQVQVVDSNVACGADQAAGYLRGTTEQSGNDLSKCWLMRWQHAGPWSRVAFGPAETGWLCSLHGLMVASSILRYQQESWTFVQL